MSDFVGNGEEEEDSEFLDAVEGPPVVEDCGKISELSQGVANLSTVDSEDSDQEKGSDEYEDSGHARSIDEALSAKEEGNAHFRDKNYPLALERYSRAIYMCPLEEEHNEQRAIFYGNRSACHSAMSNWDMVVEDCTKAVELHDTYAKVVMRRCQAYEQLEKYDEAILGM